MSARNIGIHAASGELVAHLDDDDLYAPGYLAFMATRMSHFDGASALKLSSWYVGNAEAGAFGFCDAARLGRKRHMSRKTPAVKMGLYSFGFTLIYNREIALKHPFQDKNLGEDYDWCMELMEQRGTRSIALMPDEFGVCLHVQHGENVSDVDPFVYTDVPLSEIRALRVVDSPGFPSFVKLAELVARVDEARKGGALPPKLAKEARDAGIISDNDDAEGQASKEHFLRSIRCRRAWTAWLRGEYANRLMKSSAGTSFAEAGSNFSQQLFTRLCGEEPASSFLEANTRGKGSRNKAKHQALVMDEIAWRSTNIKASTGPVVNLESYDWAKDVLDHLAGASQAHNGKGLKVTHSNNPFGSDHISFLQKGIHSVLSIHGDDEGYPHYHQSADNLDQVDPSLYAMITKMNAGALLRLAGIDA
eukprot:s1976_g8.t1